MADFISSYGVLIVAAIALLQPYIWALWKRYFRQGRIDTHETGYIEIGFSTIGPSIGLNGTLRSSYRDMFVQGIQLELEKQKDHSKHIFEWGIFRSEKIAISGEQQGTLELPSGFMLLTSSPRRFNIQFLDMQVQSEMRQVINKVSKEWWAKIRTELKPDELSLLWSQHASSSSELEDRLHDLYETFVQDHLHVSSYTTLDRKCYWEAGKYTLTFIVRTSKPDKSFERTWSFTLTEQDVQSIRLNIIKLLQDTCGRPSYGPYNFAYVKYETIS